MTYTYRVENVTFIHSIECLSYSCIIQVHNMLQVDMCINSIMAYVHVAL